MKGSTFLFCSLMIFQFVSWVCVTVSSRPFAPYHDVPAVHQQGTDQLSPQSSQSNLISSKEGNKSMTEVAEVKEEAAEAYKGVNKIGSSPPSCEHKCYGCMPCEATQVPTTAGRVGVQYANYEPEDWKCKCGPTFYSP